MTPSEILLQLLAALPDKSFAAQEGITAHDITTIEMAITHDNINYQCRIIRNSRDVLTRAWARHGGCPSEILALIDSV